MWLLMTRRERPDRPCWRGRRVLSALDAIGWPLAWIGMTLCLPTCGGVLGALIVAWAAISAATRLRAAIRANHRLDFTTWRCLKLAVYLGLWATLVKVVLAYGP